MRIKLDSITDPDLQVFLKTLSREGLDGVIVLGGAVRDMLLLERCQDIDITFRLAYKAPKNVVREYYGQPLVMLPALSKAIRPLAKVLRYKPEAFYDPLPFGSSTIDVLGLIPIEDAAGTKYPDMFVDERNNIFGACPDLSVNRIALDPDGTIWPRQNIYDLHNGIARLVKAPLEIRLRQVLRTLIMCTRVGLNLTPESSETLRAHLCLLRSREQFLREIRDVDTISLIQKMLGINRMELTDTNHLRIVNSLEEMVDRASRTTDPRSKMTMMDSYQFEAACNIEKNTAKEYLEIDRC